MASNSSMFLRRVLAGGVVLGTAWWFHSQMLVPLQQRERECLRAIDDVQRRLTDARAVLQEIRDRETKVASAGAALDPLRGEAPKDPTVIWLPERLKKDLHSGGIAEAGIRVNSALPEPFAGGYERTYWHINVPQQPGIPNMNAALLAVTEIERQESFVRILDLTFRADPDEPHRPAGSLNVSAIVRK